MTETRTTPASLNRQLGLAGLTATGICSMIGASIYVVPFMIQRNVPGIGPYVLPAFLLAALPALMAAFAYALLSSAMPRAGGSYIYASRALHPYLGFVASFSQWFGLSIVIGVISFVIVPFVRDVALALSLHEIAAYLDRGWIRVSFALLFLWSFVFVNIRGIKLYERTLLPLMLLMFVLGGIVIIAGWQFNHDDFIMAVAEKEGRVIEAVSPSFSVMTLITAASLLFASFIGFDSIAQAGGEAKNPSRNLPLAIFLAILFVSLYYLLFTQSVYHAVPWYFVATEAWQKDVTAPGLLSYVLPSGWGVLIVVGAAIALLNDLPAMILSVSRLMYSWAEDGIFPSSLSQVHTRYRTPHRAIMLSGSVASIGILGCHFAGDFFLGIDIMVTSMMVNFLLMCVSLLGLPKRNPKLAANISLMKSRPLQQGIAITGIVLIGFFLVIHTVKDLSNEAAAWYFHSTPVWMIVMVLASVVFWIRWRNMIKAGVNTRELFSKLPDE
jgi:basic amino acid/polyamine antiporter, APA family